MMNKIVVGCWNWLVLLGSLIRSVVASLGRQFGAVDKDWQSNQDDGWGS